MATQVGEPPTAAKDETSSQPSTSAGINEETSKDEATAKDETSDSEVDIPYEEFNYKKDVCVKKIVLCEHYMNRMRITLKSTRLKEYRDRIVDIGDRKDADYLYRVAAMEAEEQKKQDKEETIYNLEKAALERDHEGEMDMINRGYRDRIQYKKAQLLYDAKVKLEKIVDRIRRENEVRQDARIYIGKEVPDDWLDEFVKSYVDEVEAYENSEEVVREKNRRRYRMEAGESLDDGRPLSHILDKAVKNGRWGPVSSLRPVPQTIYDQIDQLRIGRESREERQKFMEDRLSNISHKTFGRFFGHKMHSKPVKSVRVDPEEISEDELEGEEKEDERDARELERSESFVTRIEMMEKRKKLLLKRMKELRKKMDEIKKTTTNEIEMITLKDAEVITLDDGEEETEKVPRIKKVAVRGKKRRRSEKEKADLELHLGDLFHCQSEIDKMEKVREKMDRDEERRNELKMRKKELALQKRLEEIDWEESDESASDEDQIDFDSIVRQGVSAILKNRGKPATEIPDRSEKRIGRLKSRLATMIDMRRKYREDPELALLQNSMIETTLGELNEKEDSNPSEDEEYPAHDFTLEQRVRDASFVRGLVERSVNPMMGDWLDRDGRAEGTIERVRERKEKLIEQVATLKKTLFREPKVKKYDSDEEDEEDDVMYRRKKERKKEKEEEEGSIYTEEEEEEVAIEERELTEEERAEKEAKERKLRQIRAVIEGRDPNEIDEWSAKDEEKDDEKEEEEEVVDEEEEEKKSKLEIELDKLRKIARKNGKKYRRRHRFSSSSEEEVSNRQGMRGFSDVPAYRLAEKPRLRMNVQLSQERIMQDLIRSGALREEETYGEHIAKMDKKRRQRMLSQLPSTSSISLANLLSPRSRMALDKMPKEAFGRLSKRERAAYLEDMPSTSKDYEDSSDEELSEGWVLEEEDEKEEVKDEEEMMEVDGAPMEEERIEEMEEPRHEETVEFSPPSAVGASPLLHEIATKKKKSVPRMNGFSRTGTAAAF